VSLAPLPLARHLAKRVLGRPDPGWEFRRFLDAVHPGTRAGHDAVLDWAVGMARRAGELETAAAWAASSDPLVRQGHALRRAVLERFRGLLRGQERLRVLVHVPPPAYSPGGFSLFSNLVRNLDFIGVPARALGWDEPVAGVLAAFRPTVFLTSDNDPYLERVDWGAVAAWRREAGPLLVGLTASCEADGNTPLPGRILRARALGAGFHYGFCCPEHYRDAPGFAPLREAGGPVLSLEFGADVLHYYPVPGVARDLDHVFLGSVNRSKWSRYRAWLGPVAASGPGFIDGPGWPWAGRCLLCDAPPAAQRYVYARARVGLNLHLDVQAARTADLNERTYQLAACGVPQVVDRPGLLARRLDLDGLFVADDPQDYARAVRRVLADPDEAVRRALTAQAEVFARHTWTHRAEAFARRLLELLDAGGGGA